MPSVRFVIHRGVPVAPDVAARLRAQEAAAMAVEADVLAAELAEAERVAAAAAEPVHEPVPLLPPDPLPPVPLLPPDPVAERQPEPVGTEDPPIEPPAAEPADPLPEPVPVAGPAAGPMIVVDQLPQPVPLDPPDLDPPDLEPDPEPLRPPDPALDLAPEPEPEPEPLRPPDPALDLAPEPAPEPEPDSEPLRPPDPALDLAPEPEPEPELDPDREWGSAPERASEPESLPGAGRHSGAGSAPAHRALVSDLLPARRRRRHHRPRHRRRTWLPLVTLLVLAAATLTGIGSWLAGRPGHPGTGTATGQAGLQQTAVLLLRDSDEVLAAALLGVSEQGGVAVLIPAALVLEVPGSGRQPLDAAYAARPTAPAKALSDALGIRVDGSWVLSTAGLRALVDSAGGVTVDVDEDLNWHGVQLVQGRGQRLDGSAAVAFASADVAGEPPESHLSRFGSVLGRVLAGLPPRQQTVGAQLAALGQESSDLLPPGRLAGMLVHARELTQSDSWQGFVLPTRLSEVGDSTVTGLDAARARQLVEQQLPGARISEPSGGVVRVLVRNGVGVPGLSEAARDRLLAADLRFVAGGNADGFGRPSTVVLIASDSRLDRDRGGRVARALGVRSTQIQVNPLGSAMADVVVVLGKDFADDVVRHSVRG